jgi:hypothetical protein
MYLFLFLSLLLSAEVWYGMRFGGGFSLLVVEKCAGFSGGIIERSCCMDTVRRI